MTDHNNTPETKETTIVPVSPETNALVEQEMAGESDQLKAETKALVEAIRKRAQSEIENAQTLTQEAYLNAIRSARKAVENNSLLDPKRIEHSVEMIQRDAQENWQKTVDEITALGDRLQEAAQAAWDILMGKDNSGTK
jgi:F0F1-type ATP synthase membrane subunit b/b'